jgi:hypothetical protein
VHQEIILFFRSREIFFELFAIALMTEGTFSAAIDESILHYRNPLNLYTATITPESILITRQLTPPLEGKTCLPPGFIQD